MPKSDICWHHEGDGEFSMYKCSQGKSLRQWMVGLFGVVMLEAITIGILGLVVNSFFGYNLFDFKKTTNRFVWGGIAAVGILSILLYIHRYGIVSFGARHAASDARIQQMKQQIKIAKHSDDYAVKFDQQNEEGK